MGRSYCNRHKTLLIPNGRQVQFILWLQYCGDLYVCALFYRRSFSHYFAVIKCDRIWERGPYHPFYGFHICCTLQYYITSAPCCHFFHIYRCWDMHPLKSGGKWMIIFQRTACKRWVPGSFIAFCILLTRCG